MIIINLQNFEIVICSRCATPYALRAWRRGGEPIGSVRDQELPDCSCLAGIHSVRVGNHARGKTVLYCLQGMFIGHHCIYAPFPKPAGAPGWLPVRAGRAARCGAATLSTGASRVRNSAIAVIATSHLEPRASHHPRLPSAPQP